MKTYVQQIMLGTVTGSEKAARETLRQIRDAGYEGLELNSFMIRPASLLVRMLTKAAGMPAGRGGSLDWQSLLEGSGLSAVSLHSDLGSLERDAASVAADARRFGTDTVVITGMYRFGYGAAQDAEDLAGRLNRAGEALKKEGAALLYHNHNAELLQLGDGRRAYDVLIDGTDPGLVNFEFDSYWFAEGGADAKAWMKRLGTRMKLWHVTDRGSRQNGPCMTPILKSDSVELGTGNMDLDGLWETAAENGVGSVILETHRNWIGGDPVESLKRSAAWLRDRK